MVSLKAETSHQQQAKKHAGLTAVIAYRKELGRNDFMRRLPAGDYSPVDWKGILCIPNSSQVNRQTVN